MSNTTCVMPSSTDLTSASEAAGAAAAMVVSEDDALTMSLARGVEFYQDLRKRASGSRLRIRGSSPPATSRLHGNWNVTRWS